MNPDARKPGAAPQAQEGQSEQWPDAVSLGVSIMEQQRVKNPALAAKQARLLALLKAETPPPVAKVWADDDPNRPETEEDGIRAGALRIAKYRQQAQQQRARAEAAKPQPPEPDPKE